MIKIRNRRNEMQITHKEELEKEIQEGFEVRERI